MRFSSIGFIVRFCTVMRFQASALPDIIKIGKNVYLLKPTLMVFSWVVNSHGPQPQPTANRPPTCSLSNATGSNQAHGLYFFHERNMSHNLTYYNSSILPIFPIFQRLKKIKYLLCFIVEISSQRWLLYFSKTKRIWLNNSPVIISIDLFKAI